MKNFFKINLVAVLFNFSCSESSDSTVCSAEFKEIKIEVYSQTGVLIDLDDFQVVDIRTNEDITSTLQNKLLKQTGIYTIANDATNFTGQETLNILFIGVMDSQIVLREPYEIGRDECHIQLISGDTKLVVRKS